MMFLCSCMCAGTLAITSEAQYGCNAVATARSVAEKLLGLIAEQLGRGESVCVPVYEGGKPSGWWFVGYTID